MSRYTKFGIVLIVGFAAILFFMIPPTPSSDGAYVIVDNVRISVEIADNFETRAKGLMFRDPLPENHGMIFIFENEENYPFWMANMKFNLDIIWMDSKGEVVYIARNVAPCGVPCSAVDPKANAKYVLEVNAGFADRYKIDKGSMIEIFLPRP